VRALAIFLSVGVHCVFSNAADYSLTGFGTVGYAVSDQRAPYLRYIDKAGTFRADSLVGLQGEAQFDPQWGATLQVVGSAPRYKEEGVAAQVRWAFVSYRPNNEWLLRAGRLRPPVLLNTQNAEVGVTYEQARLPVEVYSLSPAYDLDGVAFGRTWMREGSEMSVDAYLGKSNIRYRMPFQRDPLQSIFPDKYFPEVIDLVGLVVSRSQGPLQVRGGLHKAVLRPTHQRQFVDAFVPMPFTAPPPFGGTIYVPGAVINKFALMAITLGAEFQSARWKVTGEYGQRIVHDTKMAIGSKSVYVTVEREVEKWTPYVGYARLLSPPATRQLFQDLNTTPVPLGAQGAPFFVPANFHQIVADGIFVFDQYSTMLGASYNLSLTSKLKFEWMRTKVGAASALVDGDVHHKSFNVFSMSYNFAF
jgi:hypothetical protein